LLLPARAYPAAIGASSLHQSLPSPFSSISIETHAPGRPQGHRVIPQPASNVGQMLNRVCLEDKIGLVKHRSRRARSRAAARGRSQYTCSTAPSKISNTITTSSTRSSPRALRSLLTRSGADLWLSQILLRPCEDRQLGGNPPLFSEIRLLPSS